MRVHNIVLMTMVAFAILLSQNVYAGGPGFDKNVYNWNSGDDDDGDDDSYGGGDDDDNYGGGDDDDNYGGGDDDDDYGGGDDDDDSNEIPLDGGLSFLAAAGAGLGIKKARDTMAKRKKNK